MSERLCGYLCVSCLLLKVYFDLFTASLLSCLQGSGLGEEGRMVKKCIVFFMFFYVESDGEIVREGEGEEEREKEGEKEKKW